MRKKRAVVAPLLGIALLLITLLGFAGTAPPRTPAASSGTAVPEAGPPPAGKPNAGNGLVFAASPRVRRIGDGVGTFHLDLGVPVESVTRAFLTYELAGVPHWTATVRSINGLPPQGGFGGAPSSGMALQVEEINPHWLRPGSNEVVFLPAGPGEPLPRGISKVEEGSAAADPIPYTVRNLQLVVFTEGARRGAPRLRITHPARGESGEDGIYLRGFVDPASMAAGPAELFVNAEHVPGGVRPADGSFAVLVPRTAPAGEAWDVEVEVVYPDGTRLRKTIHLKGKTGDGDGDDDSPAEKAEADAKAGEAKGLSLGKARIDVPAGALAGPVKLTMRRLIADELPALDSGMTNVTPLKGGVRMGPHGLRFKKPIHLSLPYDPALIPQGMGTEDVRTFFFDEVTGRWVQLPRIEVKSEVKSGETVVVSATDHFTDFINATLTAPDEPAGASFAPNSLQDLATADPASAIDLIEPPDGGPMGDAELDYPLRVPPGRHGLQPELAVAYSSGSGNGWLGLGWDLAAPSVEVSTNFGAPRYDPAAETETYRLNGAQLAPTANLLAPAPRQAERLFTERKEGSFHRIVRHGSGPADYWWEVTDKNGTRFLYGRSPQARLRSAQGTFRWYLERVVDLHGNTVDYTYTTDSGSNGEPWVQVYLSRIDYTGGPEGAPFYQVQLHLDDLDGGNQRPDRLSTGMPGFKVYTRHRLDHVDVLAGGSLVRRYRFSYRTGDFGKSLLDAVAMTGEDGETELYRHTFDYFRMPREGDGYDGFAAEEAWGGIRGSDNSTDTVHAGGGAHGFAGLGPVGCQPHFGVQVGGSGTDTTTRVSFLDVNGDGLPDRINQDGRVDLNRFDPLADRGTFAPGSFSGADTLNHTSEWSLDFGVGLHAEAGITASLDASWVWSHSNDDKAMADVNGDGLPDLVSTAGGFTVRVNDGKAFKPSATWTGFGGGGLNLSAPGEEAEVLAKFRLADTLRKLVLPYAGRVNLSGAVQKLQAGGDGATVEIFHNGTRVWRHEIAAGDTAACLPGPGDSCGGGLGFDVAAGDNLYFLADSVRETSADALLWAPGITYDGRDPQALEPYGARVYGFDARDDFRLAGFYGAAWVAPARGTVRVTGPIAKQPTSDDVVITVSRSHGGGAEVPVYTRNLAAAEVGSFEEVPPIAVEAGDALFLRVTSDTPIDPERAQWTPTVTYEGGEYCRAPLGGGAEICGAVSCGPETCTLAGDPMPDVPLRTSLVTQRSQVAFGVPRLLPASTPTQSFPAPGNGEQSFSVSWSGSSRAILLVQGINRLIDKRELLPGPSSFPVTAQTVAGEPLFFTVFGDGADPGTLEVEGGSVPVNVRHRAGGSGEVLSGGYHGWYYGEGNGNKAFDPAGLAAPSGSDDPKDFVPAVPRWQGTDIFSGPAWVAGGFDLYLAAEGGKPSRQGANAAGTLDQSQGSSSGGGLGVLRKTFSRTEGVSAGAGAGLSLSEGFSETQLDLVDMNGDRYPDQVSASGVRFSDGHGGFGPLVPFGGLDSQVRRVEDGNVSTTIGVGINFVKKSGKGKPSAVLSTLPSLGNTVSLSQIRYDLMDVNGDGLPDRVGMEPGAGALSVQLNLGYRFGAPEAWPLPRWDSSAGSRCTDAVDFVSSAVSSGVSRLDTLDTLSFTRSSALHAGFAIGPFGGGAVTTLARTLVELVDVDGDGLPDHVAKESGDDFFRVKLNQGDGWGPEQRWYAPRWSASVGDGFNPFNVFRCLDAVSFQGNVEINGSVGAPICIPLIPPIPVVGLQIEISGQAFAGEGGLQLSFGDLDGDGLPDHVLKKSGDPNVYVKRNKAEKVNLLSTVHRPLGATIALDYQRQGNRVDLEHGVDMPSTQWVLASSTIDDGRGNVYTTRYQYFDDAFYDRAEREGYGFAHVREVRPDGSTVDRIYLNQDLYRRYLPVKEVIADRDGSLFRVETMEYDLRSVGSGSAFPALVKQATYFYEGTTASEAGYQKATLKTFDYDGLGNLIRTTDSGDEGTDDDVVAALSYHVDPTAYVVKPEHFEVRDGAGRLLRRRDAAYDGQGELVRLEQTLIGGKDPQTGSAYSGTKNAVSTFAYDASGNMTQSVDPTGFTTTYSWDGETHTYPVATSDSFGYTSRTSYDLKHGLQTEVVDENGSSIRRSYDGFGRLVRVVGPEDSDDRPALDFEYGPAANPPVAVVHQKDATRSDPIDTAVFIDGLGRTIETKADADLDLGTGTATREGMRVSGRVTFDLLGRVASQGQPAFDTNPASRFVDVPLRNATSVTYDVLDRVREVRFPHGAVTRLDYGFGTLDGVTRLSHARTDSNGHLTRFYDGVRGEVLGVEQTNTIGGASRRLVTRYGYNALSQLTSVTDAKGNVTRLEYDTLGRNVVLDNPDAGRTEHRYDPSGELGAEITANLAARGQQIRYLRTFHRLDRIDYPEMTDVVFTYGPPGAPFNRANRTVTVTDESGVEERSYDRLGEVVRSVKTAAALNGGSPKGPYTTSFAFDSFNRLLSLTWPDGETLTYTFDAGGQVKTAAGVLNGVRTDYLRHVGYDEFGERVRTVYGNGVETRWSYDPQSRFLAQLQTLEPTGQPIQSQRYQHDLTGSLLAIQSDLPVPGSSHDPGPASRTFRYDALNQLTGADGSYREKSNKLSTYTFSLAYDELGNTTAKTQLHYLASGGGNPNLQKKTSVDQTYLYGSSHPHAPVHIGDRTFQYDLNGNQTGWDSDSNGTRHTNTWDEENRLKSAADNGQTTRFLYAAAGARTNKAGQHGETIYVNPYFSLRNGANTSKHVFADGDRIATRISNPSVVYFYHPDHLGSSQLVTDDRGETYQHLEYFPSGEIWVDERTETQRTPFLFSGKELDEETGFSYFGFRYYDARQGQWISADPVLDGMLDLGKLTRPGLSSEWFRQPGHLYAYAANSPTNLIDSLGLDPSGPRKRKAPPEDEDEDDEKEAVDATSVEDLMSEGALAGFQKNKGGSTQGTLVLIEMPDGGYYMVEQQTNNRIKAAAEDLGITYIPQGRLSGFHAEMRFIKHGREQTLSLKGAKVWVSKPICADCAKRLRKGGLKIMTSTTSARYRNWVSPDTDERTVPSSGRAFRGRRTEVQRLQESLPSSWNG